MKINEEFVSSPKLVANILGQHFANISSAAHYSLEFQTIRDSTIVTPPASNNTEAYNLSFSMQELQNALSNSAETSPGEDNIHYSMISHLPICSRKFLLNILNGLWNCSSSPSSWKTSIIIPILKPGKDPYLALSYRPIALTSCISKLYERMVNTRLVWYLESKNLLSNRQFGFRKNRSTTDPLTMLAREIQNAFAKQNQTIAVFFDLEKAYDTTWRVGILQQLAIWGIGGKMFGCIKDFLSARHLKVRVGSEFSSPYFQEEGIPQGSVLSVTLFNIAINGLLERTPLGVQGLAYADDFVMYCSASTAVEACHKIQRAIDSAVNWTKARGYKFSPQKTKAMRFSLTRRAEEIPTLLLDGRILQYENSVKYLGIIFDKKLTFGQHIIELANNVKKACNILKVVSNFNWGADRTTLLRLYSSLCLSKMDYGCQVYGSACKTNLHKLDIVHNMALRICTGAYRTSPIESIYVDSGMVPLSNRREELGLRYISKVPTSKFNPNYKYIKNPIDLARNKPRIPKPIEVRLKDSASTIGLGTTQVMEIKPPASPPWCRPPVKICQASYSKKCFPPEQLKSEFLEHVEIHSGLNTIYTDGSKTADGVGFAVITKDSIIKKRLPNCSSIFTAELQAISKALSFIFNCESSAGQKYVIHTDSLSVLVSIGKLVTNHHLVQEVHYWLVLLHSRKQIEVQFCWVPAHIGIEGNEQADSAAKEATLFHHCQKMCVPHTDLNNIIRKYVRNKWQASWSSLTREPKLRRIRPIINDWHCSYYPNRRASIILSRLRIGHTFLTHRFLLASGQERQVPRCETCNCDMSVKHILIECNNFNIFRSLNHLDGRPIEEILSRDCYVDNILRFLKQIKLYYEI